MSLDTWTPAAVTSNSELFEGAVNRFVLVEASAATQKITDSLAEFELIENLVAKSVEEIDLKFEKLHTLLAKPFLTRPHAKGSRFGSPTSKGVFYSAINLSTAAAERGFYVQKFLFDSPGLLVLNQRHSQFLSSVSVQSIDTRLPPFHKDFEIFENKFSYAYTQKFADVVRQSKVGAIKYKSVRDPNGGVCLAILTPDGFSKPNPTSIDSAWTCYASLEKVYWFNPYVNSKLIETSLEFTY